jgi:hypothetical protein
MACLLHDQDGSELDVAGSHLPIGLERLLQRHGLDLRAHADQDTEVQRLLVLIGRAGASSSVPGVVACMARYVAFIAGPRIFKSLPKERRPPDPRTCSGCQ